jgi:hypothetical protein
MPEQRPDLEELLRKLRDLQSINESISSDTRREFEALMRLVYKRQADHPKG